MVIGKSIKKSYSQYSPILGITFHKNKKYMYKEQYLGILRNIRTFEQYGRCQYAFEFENRSMYFYENDMDIEKIVYSC
jgi:hypothetical protein